MSISTMAENSALRLGVLSQVQLAARKAAAATGQNVDIDAATNVGVQAARSTRGLLPKINAAAKGAADAAEQQPGSSNVDVAAAANSGVEAATEGPSTGITSASALSQLVTFIPTETIAFWLAVQTALGAVEVPSGKDVCEADFGSRWSWFWILFAATAILTIGLSYRQQKNKDGQFHPPVLETVVALLAFSVWALSLTSSPLQDFCAFTVEVWGPVLLLGGTIAVAAIAFIFGLAVKWDKVLTSDTP